MDEHDLKIICALSVKRKYPHLLELILSFTDAGSAVLLCIS